MEDKGVKEILGILLAGNYITAADARAAALYAAKRHVPVEEYLLNQGLVNKDLLGQAMAESLGVPYADLNTNAPSSESLAAIPTGTAHALRIVLFAQKKTEITVATDHPKNPALKKTIGGLFPKKKVVIAFALPEDINNALTQYRKPLETRFSKIIETEKRVAPNIIDEILSDALSYRASDVHFEPQAEEVLVRFRVDGVLQEAGRLPRVQYENILNRIKVQSRLRIDEHYSAQDGAMRFEKDGAVADLRTSVVPTIEGEKVVLRVLASYVQGLTLSAVGLSAACQAIIEDVADKPFGMILVSGPTGSGKTTTLYALLQLLNDPNVNIMTIEDPVEYKVSGINQIQVNLQTNLSFAKGLRSIVRQDPDVILVGEIRDDETAEIAINSALTGHLLLSTFHANDAATAIPRLLDMGIEPFLLASTLQLIVSQRLIRKICEQCRTSLPLAEALAKQPAAVARCFVGKKQESLYRGKGCPTCGNTGYKGRTAIFECIRMTPELQEQILRSPSSPEIWQIARRQGAISLFDDGLEKVKAGVTTIEELLRVAEPPTVRVLPKTI